MKQHYRLSADDQAFALAVYQKVLRRDTQNPPGNEAHLVSDLIELFKEVNLTGRMEQRVGERANFMLDVLPEDPSARKQPLRCFNGHLDTVPQGDPAHWGGSALEPRLVERADGTHIIARGSTDMKGGLSAMVTALYLIRKYKLPLQRPLRLLGTYDEESGGTGAKSFCEAGGLDDVAQMIICEPSALTLSVCAKGAIWLQFELEGKTAHAAYPEQGKNTLVAAYAIYDALSELIEIDEHPLLGPSTCTLVQLNGGVKTNMVPDHAKLVLDIRLVPERDQEQVLRKATEKAHTVAAEAGCKLKVQILNQRIAVEIPEEDPLCTEVSQTFTELWPGEKPGISGARFFSDASIFRLYRKDLPVLILGPGDPAMCHKPEEEAPLAQFYRAIELYVALMTS